MKGFNDIKTAFGVLPDGTHVYTVGGIQGSRDDVHELIERLQFTLEMKDIYERAQAKKTAS